MVSTCVLMYLAADVSRVKRLINMPGKGRTRAIKRADGQKLELMKAMCSREGRCRRLQMVEHFDERPLGGTSEFPSRKGHCAGD